MYETHEIQQTLMTAPRNGKDELRSSTPGIYQQATLSHASKKREKRKKRKKRKQRKNQTK